MLGHPHIPPFIPRENMRHVVSVSGGKDSGATYLHALELLDGDFLAVCADTGNEHPETLEYVARLHERTGGPKVQIIKADFTVDLARKKRFLESGKAVARTKNHGRKNMLILHSHMDLKLPGCLSLTCAAPMACSPAESQRFALSG